MLMDGYLADSRGGCVSLLSFLLYIRNEKKDGGTGRLTARKPDWNRIKGLKS